MYVRTFQLHNMVLLTIVTVFYIRFSDLTSVAENLYHLTNL